jgi:hypothetical protein
MNNPPAFALDYVRSGEYLTDPTVVLAHVPELPGPGRRLSEGMKPLDNGRHILRCYEAFIRNMSISRVSHDLPSGYPRESSGQGILK